MGIHGCTYIYTHCCIHRFNHTFSYICIYIHACIHTWGRRERRGGGKGEVGGSVIVDRVESVQDHYDGQKYIRSYIGFSSGVFCRTVAVYRLFLGCKKPIRGIH